MRTGAHALPIVVVGAGGHARVVADIIRLSERYIIIGYLDDVHPERHAPAVRQPAVFLTPASAGRPHEP